jgi:hypothetical protein
LFLSSFFFFLSIDFLHCISRILCVCFLFILLRRRVVLRFFLVLLLECNEKEKREGDKVKSKKGKSRLKQLHKKSRFFLAWSLATFPSLPLTDNDALSRPSSGRVVSVRHEAHCCDRHRAERACGERGKKRERWNAASVFSFFLLEIERRWERAATTTLVASVWPIHLAFLLALSSAPPLLSLPRAKSITSKTKRKTKKQRFLFRLGALVHGRPSRPSRCLQELFSPQRTARRRSRRGRGGGGEEGRLLQRRAPRE